ncbi:Uu.00g066040.m01.CDS01 [Anthostomella pinea]|uniref:Uu.00g066040.m01.CDS01 n=1 Tax=Anthostomella pinea TaxID=933095 RepID=A0AAI8VUN5_9PEZI|nr:Uu.00g066040.m01.CDS01 [Anthostomella pinea]
MSSRFGAARPKRAGENYARQNHNAEPDSKKVKFDVRNPSALAADVDDEDEGADAYLEADAEVIRGSAATKRGAVNIDGYDSDSDREELGTLHASKSKATKDKKDDDEDVDDMFAAEAEDGDPKDDAVDNTTGKKSKEVRFLDAAEIEGQDTRSRSGGHVHTDDPPSSEDDEEEVALAIQEEDIDEEVGAGGLKKHAPKVEAFNLKAEQEEGRFDESGNFVRKAVDPDAVHDRWLEGVSKKEMKKAAEAHEKREAEQREKRREEDNALTSDLLKSLILKLERGETALEALARLGRGQTKAKKVPKWKQKKQKPDVMELDAEKAAEDPEQVRIKEAIDAITDAADKLLGRDRPDIYDRERELLIREYAREADEEWVEPQQKPEAADAKTRMWEYRWTDGRDDADKQGPFDEPTMNAWQDAGYFGAGIEFREVGSDSWTRAASFV